MKKIKAAMAAVLALEKEGTSKAFGVPDAAIEPFYADSTLVRTFEKLANFEIGQKA